MYQENATLVLEDCNAIPINDHFNTDPVIDYDDITINFRLAFTNLPSSIHYPQNGEPGSTSLDFFELLMTSDMVNQIKATTNRSILNAEHEAAMDRMSSDGDLRLDIQGIIVNGIRCFLDMQLFMGLQVLPQESMYFLD